MKKKITKIYNHMFDVAFNIATTVKDPYKVASPDLMAALERRVEYLKKHPLEWDDAFGYCGEVYQKKS